jgi:DnaJ-domain-containing protein 1
MCPATPVDLEGLGAATVVPTLSRPLAELAALGLSAEEGFVLSRVDGKTSLGGICMLVPFEVPHTTRLLRRLYELGAIAVPGLPPPPPPQAPPKETRARSQTPPQTRARSQTPPQTRARSQTPPQNPVPVEPPSDLPTAVPPGVDLTLEQVRRIDTYFLTLGVRDAYQLLDVTRDADEREVRRAYFRLSKEFHPDRFFGKNIGEYRERVSQIFKSIKAAFELLSDAERRAEYEASAGKPS